MANDNVIDELSLQIDSNANAAIKGLSSLQTQLRHLAKSIYTVSAANKSLSNLANSFKGFENINTDNMRKAVTQLQRLSKLEFKPLDSKTFKVDTASIEKQLSGSLSKASGKKYNIDVASVGKLAENLKLAGDSMAKLSESNPKTSGLNTAISAFTRLSGVDMSKFNSDTFSELLEGIRSTSQIGDISPVVNRFVSSLARLANAGDKANSTAKFLPVIGEALKTVAGHLASVGGLPAELNAFVGSIAQLANAGNKTQTTSENLKQLGESLTNFISHLSQAPEVSQNLVQMTSAIAELAQAGGKAGTAAKSINKGIGSVAEDSGKANDKIKVLTAVVDDMGKVFGKAAGLIKSGASRIVNSLRQIKSAGSGLSGATQSIKNMIAAMVGFRGVQGLVNLSKQVMELGANMTEIDHIVESVFGNMATVVDDWSKTAITKFGIAEHSAKQYAGTLSAMFQASGIGYQNAGLMGIKLTELAGKQVAA